MIRELLRGGVLCMDTSMLLHLGFQFGYRAGKFLKRHGVGEEAAGGAQRFESRPRRLRIHPAFSGAGDIGRQAKLLDSLNGGGCQEVDGQNASRHRVII